MTPDEHAVLIVRWACFSWLPPQVKAVFVERNDRRLIVHLGCDVADERVREAEEDIATDTHSASDGDWVVDSQIHESPDIAGWRARGWLPVHLTAEWGEGWIEPCDRYATDDAPPEWRPGPAELARPEFQVRPAALPPDTEWRVEVALTQALVGQLTPTVAAIRAVVSTDRVTVHWHLDSSPDTSTARAMNVTTRRLQERCRASTDLDFLEVGHHWYVHDPHPPESRRGRSFLRDDPRTGEEQDRDDVSAPGA